MKVHFLILKSFSNKINTLFKTLIFLMVSLLNIHTVNADTSTTLQFTDNSLTVLNKTMVVYKSPTCGCCGDWVDYMNEAGFTTKIQHPKDLNAIKDQLGVAPVYQSCHTATLADYLFEGHIPSEAVKKFLADKPSNALGLTVPGMPLGSPGMDFGGDNYRPYQILQINKDGSSTVYGEVSSNRKITYR